MGLDPKDGRPALGQAAPKGGVKKQIARFLRQVGLRPPLPGQQYAPAPTRGPRAPAAPIVQTHEIAFDRSAYPRKATLTLSTPRLTPSLNAVFCDHPLQADGQAGRRVFAATKSTLYVSEDLGGAWTAHELETEHEIERLFVTSTGHILTSTSPMAAPGDAETTTVVRRYGPDFRPAGAPFVTRSPWHGSRAIGESDGVILFAEYPINRGKYDQFQTGEIDPIEALVSNPRVFRSRDDGRTWDVCFQVPIEIVRHLHTCAPDHSRPGRWLVTSGDRHDEVHVWMTEDHGDTWTEITSHTVATPLPPTCRPVSVQRMTDKVFHDGWVIWGSDDILGNLNARDTTIPVGSRVFKARLDGGKWEPIEIGYAGKLLRSIVDVGPAFVFTTEAKYAAQGFEPESFILFKDDLDTLHPLATFENHLGKGTGFTYSRSSAKARDGVFFSYRGARDVFNTSPRLLRWEIAFS